MYLKLHSHCACELYYYGRVVVGRAGLRCGGYFVGTVIGFPLMRNPRAFDRSVITLAGLGGLISPEHRGSAFGLFDTVFGISWFLGCTIMGVLYGRSLLALVLFSVAAQVAAAPLLLFANQSPERT